MTHRRLGGGEHVVGADAGSYERLADIYHHLLSEQSLDVLLDVIADALSDLVPYDTLTIYRADHAHQVLVPILARDDWADQILSTRPAFGTGITGWAVDHRKPVHSNQAHLDERRDMIPGTPPEPEALISVPLISRGSVKGALNVYRQGEGAAFTEKEFQLAQQFADPAALALDNAQIRAALEHQAQTDPLTGLYNHRYFHERLRSELMRLSRTRDAVALLLLDIDDFKKLNDIYGHATGDSVLVRLADVMRATVRASDVACRIGGEEFAVILPSCDAGDAMGLARRLRDRMAVLDVEGIAGITLSVGISQGPEHATNPRELVACAETAMMTAKARGKDQAVLYSLDDVERRVDPVAPTENDDVRSIAHLKMLQSLAGKLNRLNEVRHIADTIANELRTLIDYHNCRVYLAEGSELFPVAFRGQLAAGESETAEVLPLRFGEGIAGRAAGDTNSLLIPNALECDFAIHLPGTEEIEESILAVPMLYGSRVNGVILLSKLGVGQFDEDDVRLLEVLAGQASVALENARLYESQRRETENARALLEAADRLALAPSFHAVGNLAVDEVARLMSAEQVTLWLRGKDGDYRCASHRGFAGDPHRVGMVKELFGDDATSQVREGRTRPYIVTSEELAERFPDYREPLPPVAIVPLKQDGEFTGWLAVRNPQDGMLAFTEERLRLLEGLGQQISMALQKAKLYREQTEAADVASSLLEFSHEISDFENLELLLQKVVERSASILGAPQSQLWMEEPGSGDVVCEAAWGMNQEELEKLVEFRLPVETALSLWSRFEPFTMRPEEYMSINDLTVVREDVTYALAPFNIEGKLACLVVSAPALGDYEFSERKMHLLAGIADQAKLALTNASAYQALEGTFVSTVEALANALEANDEYTSTHARSIAEMTREVGIAAGMDAGGLKRLEMAALFHDIGKIGIPSEILLKDGPLEDSEWEVMRRHPELGERILEPIERLADVRPIVRACHEHYDGNGYPDGMAGDEIPLEARIILVCDAFHAMTTDRPYRRALRVEESIERLRAKSGTQFDPNVVEMFLEFLQRDPNFGIPEKPSA
jgi:diguanylate cyclase (GGDEF)-like protein